LNLPDRAGFFDPEQNILLGTVPAMSDCVFCRILNKEIPATFLYQDEQVVAFRDINPAAPTHLLIVPRQHVPDLRAAEATQPALWTSMIRAVQHLAEAEGIGEDGFRVVVNTGAKAGQTVFHLHLHLLGGREFSSL